MVSFGFFSRTFWNSSLACFGELHVLRRLGAGNVLAHIRGGQVQARHRVVGIQLHRVLEVIHGFRVMRALVGLHAVIEGIARPEFVAARCEENQQSDSRYQYCALHDVNPWTFALNSGFCEF